MLTRVSQSVCILLLTLFAGVQHVFASQVLIAPRLIDVDVAPRDVVTRAVTLTNQTDHKLRVFATVNEVALDTTGEVKEFVSPSMTDQASTITSWTEITRGRIEIEPYASTTVQLTLRVHPYAKAGTYTEFIGFVPDPNRPMAESAALKGDADGVMVKATISEKTSGLLRISSLIIPHFVFLNSQRAVHIEVENSGDAAVVPAGEIIFYNSRGEESGASQVNVAGEPVAAGARHTFTTPIPFFNTLGRFKANVKLEYGTGSQKSNVFDTTHFFMVPYILLLLLLAAVIGVVILLTYMLRRALRHNSYDEDDDSVPLYIRNDRIHETKDHDIHIQKH